jgi:hypothetical protein
MHRLASAGAAILAVLAVTGVLAGGAAAAPAGGPIALYANAGNAGSQKVVFVGAIGDYGTARNVDKNGKVNPNGNFVKVKLTKGTFEIDSTALNETMNTDPQVASTATCSAAFTASAPVTFFNGTGLYKGISGTATVTVTFGGVAPRYKSGPKKGQCKPGENTKPRAQYGFVTGQGTVSFTA